MNVALPAWGLGTIIALVVLVLCIVLAVAGTAITAHIILGLIAALAVARLT